MRLDPRGLVVFSLLAIAVYSTPAFAIFEGHYIGIAKCVTQASGRFLKLSSVDWDIVLTRTNGTVTPDGGTEEGTIAVNRADDTISTGAPYYAQYDSGGGDGQYAGKAMLAIVAADSRTHFLGTTKSPTPTTIKFNYMQIDGPPPSDFSLCKGTLKHQPS